MVKRRKEEERGSGNGFQQNPSYLSSQGFLPVDSQPVQPVYLTRSAKALLAKCAASIPIPSRHLMKNVKDIPCESSNLRPPMNVLNEYPSTTETSNIPTGPTQDSKSQAASNYQYATRTPNETSTPTFAKKAETINSVSAESKDLPIPTSTDILELDKLASKLLAQAQGLQDLHPDALILEAHKVVVDNHPQVSEGNIDLHIVRNRAEENGNTNEKQLGRTCSFDCTKIAAMLTESHDLDEVDSAFDCALVTVGKYKVKEEVAPLLRSIFLKYGDIAEGSILKTISTRSSFLEIVCEMYQKLEKIGFKNITPAELESMLNIIGDIESVGMKLGWFRRRLDDISAALRLFQGYSSLKEAKARSFQGTERKKQEVQVLQDDLGAKKQKLKVLQDELAAMEVEAEEINLKLYDT